MKWTPRRLKWILNLYPPYFFTGIHVDHVDPGWGEVRVSMKLRWYNRNAVGTHFGGSLYAMVDPHVMLLLMGRLGDDYVVWDTTASIDFRTPGRGVVRAVIRVSDEEVEEIRSRTSKGAPYRPEFEIDVVDEEGDIVAVVTKTLYVRRRPVE